LHLAPCLILALALPASTQDVRTTSSGLQYRVLEEGGGGASPQLGDRVTVHYTGTLTDGTVFDSSRTRGRPATFTLGRVIPGWNEGLALMTRGARYELTIPPELGYGEQGAPPKIPGGATLVFDVELLDFESGEHPIPFTEAEPEATTQTESGLSYQILREGEGDQAEPGDVVEMAFAIYRPDGTLLDSSATGSGPIQGPFDQFRFDVLREAPTYMNPGCLARFDVPPEMGFGEPTVWFLELQRIVEPLPVPEFELPPDDELETTASGLRYTVIEEGEGPHPGASSTVEVHYAGWLKRNGELFDSSYGRAEPATFPLDRVIPGWTEGLQMMRPGGTWLFVIPSELAYGERGSPPTIGPDEDLVFHVELLEVE